MCFRNFTAPLWNIFAGNLLFLICSLFYLVWWVVSYQPNSSNNSSGGLYITIASITGFSAIFLISVGINSLSQESKRLPPNEQNLTIYIIIFLFHLSINQ